jgi:hypothetical protein
MVKYALHAINDIHSDGYFWRKVTFVIVFLDTEEEEKYTISQNIEQS